MGIGKVLDSFFSSSDFGFRHTPELAGIKHAFNFTLHPNKFFIWGPVRNVVDPKQGDQVTSWRWEVAL